MKAIPSKRGIRRANQQGFTLLEMLFATLILLASLVGIAQLVPAAVMLNQRNRMSANLLTEAQRQLDVLLSQPLTSVAYYDTYGETCNAGDTCALGDPMQPNIAIGSAVSDGPNGPSIDFTQPTQTGYSRTYVDTSNPNGLSYDVRWAVITQVTGATITSKRFIVGVRQVGGTGFALPVTIESAAYK